MKPPEHLKNRINISDFDYPLKEERIAKFPLAERDASKLLILKEGQISEDVFRSIGMHLPQNALMVFNQTKVVQARLFFKKESGARIEIFCLQPHYPPDYQLAFQQRGEVEWKCLVGNSKRWKSGILRLQIPLVEKVYEIQAERVSQEEELSVIRFSWAPEELSFAEMLEISGQIPIPPYLNREPVKEDRERYQTVFAKNSGSVAAPTAGLHFTDRLLKDLKKQDIRTAHVTLHVGAGTFKPVIAKDAVSHVMHYEQIAVDISTLKRLLKNKPGKIIAVGTTSVRTLESLYWYGLKLMTNKNKDIALNINQWEPYAYPEKDLPETAEVLNYLIRYMENANMQSISGTTQIMILPGYKFRLIDGMLTNFHQPKSTLLLLVSAFIGEQWRNVYDYALQHDFRFLSYGDSCLFLP